MCRPLYTQALRLKTSRTQHCCGTCARRFRQNTTAQDITRTGAIILCCNRLAMPGICFMEVYCNVRQLCGTSKENCGLGEWSQGDALCFSSSLCSWRLHRRCCQQAESGEPGSGARARPWAMIPPPALAARRCYSASGCGRGEAVTVGAEVLHTALVGTSRGLASRHAPPSATPLVLLRTSVAAILIGRGPCLRALVRSFGLLCLLCLYSTAQCCATQA